MSTFDMFQILINRNKNLLFKKDNKRENIENISKIYIANN